MDKYLITGGNTLQGTTTVSGSKNVALKALVAACLTDEEIILENIPLISDFFNMVNIMKELGGELVIEGHTAKIRMKSFARSSIPLDMASHARTSVMFIAPLLLRTKEAVIPNPGGCRLGARPVDRIIDGLEKMSASVEYKSEDGYFHAKTEGLKGIDYTFEKSTHTGTETLIIAGVLAEGKTVLRNAAEEPEVDDLISLLNKMGARIERSGDREITIHGVEKLHGTTFLISPDRNEIVTFAIAAYVTRGDVLVKEAKHIDLKAFLEKLDSAGAGYEIKDDGIRFYHKGDLRPVDVTTAVHPGFMTDWQAPWAVLMTQANGESIIHETVFENKLGYVKDLKKMGARMKVFNPNVQNPEEVYNFNLSDNSPEYFHAVRIEGPSQLHNAVVIMLDIRAGAAVVLAALAAKGETTVHNIYLVKRGYEKFDERLRSLGADIQVVED